jgi:hypothetical protein
MSKENALPSLFSLGQTQADHTKCDLGGTLEPPGPASPIDPHLFLERPSYAKVWVGGLDRPLDASHLLQGECRPAGTSDRLQGHGPSAWIAEGLGNDTFSPFGGRAIYTQTCRRVAARSKGRPLASYGNIKRAQQSGEFPQLIREHVVKPGPVLRFAPDGRTSIRTGSISYAKIYQAHHFPPETLAAEIRRVCVPGARVILCGIAPCFTDLAFGELTWQLLETLAPLRSAGERLLRTEFRHFPLALEDAQCLLTDKVTRPQYATAKWTFFELLAYLRTYPCVQRIEWQPTLVHRKFPSAVHDLLFGVFWPGLDDLRRAWGNAKKRRLVRWPVYMRTGYLPS